jgi:hypothetical protein
VPDQAAQLRRIQPPGRRHQHRRKPPTPPGRAAGGCHPPPPGHGPMRGPRRAGPPPSVATVPGTRPGRSGRCCGRRPGSSAAPAAASWP